MQSWDRGWDEFLDYAKIPFDAKRFFRWETTAIGTGAAGGFDLHAIERQSHTITDSHGPNKTSVPGDLNIGKTCDA